jgi:hypothetical protein
MQCLCIDEHSWSNPYTLTQSLPLSISIWSITENGPFKRALAMQTDNQYIVPVGESPAAPEVPSSCKTCELRVPATGTATNFSLSSTVEDCDAKIPGLDIHAATGTATNFSLSSTVEDCDAKIPGLDIHERCWIVLFATIVSSFCYCWSYCVPALFYRCSAYA